MRTLVLASALCLLIVCSHPQAKRGLKPFPCDGGVPHRDCPAGEECGLRYLVRLDFYKNKLNLDEPGRNAIEWQDFDDGYYSADCHGAKIDSNPFDVPQLSDERWLENFKYYIQMTTPIALPLASDLVFEYFGGATTFNTGKNPYPKDITQLDDWRLGHGIFSVFDKDSLMTWGFHLTNNRIYVVYARFAASTSSTYAKFQFVVPVGMRKGCDEHDMKIVFHPDRKQVSFRLKGKEVFRLLRPGHHIDRTYMVMDEGGQQESVWPKELFYGLGTGDSLDSYAACQRSDSCCDCQFPPVRMALADTGTAGAAALPQYNPLLGPPSPAVYWRRYDGNDVILPDQRLWYAWGQGVEMRLKKIVIYQDNCRKC